MKATVSYSELREKGETQVSVESSVGMTGQEFRSWLDEMMGPVVDPAHLFPPESPPEPIGRAGGSGTDQSVIFSPPERGPDTTGFAVPIPTVSAPKKIPFFDIGDAIGKVGDRVLVPVYAGCVYDMTGFHIGGGTGGYGKLRALGVKLGLLLTEYLTAQGAIVDGEERFFSKFQFVNWEDHGALPAEEWWEYALGFFSLSDERTIPGIPIPSGTELFSVEFEILPQDVGETWLSCKDEHYFTQTRRRTRKFTYTGLPGGFSEIDTTGGKITVIEG